MPFRSTIFGKMVRLSPHYLTEPHAHRLLGGGGVRPVGDQLLLSSEPTPLAVKAQHSEPGLVTLRPCSYPCSYPCPCSCPYPCPYLCPYPSIVLGKVVRPAIMKEVLSSEQAPLVVKGTKAFAGNVQAVELRLNELNSTTMQQRLVETVDEMFGCVAIGISRRVLVFFRFLITI